MLGTNVGRALAASLGYHDTARVLVCGDLFDKEGEYQRGQGLGEYINTSPHPAHVYFAATICGDLSENNEFECLFDHDKSKAVLRQSLRHQAESSPNQCSCPVLCVSRRPPTPVEQNNGRLLSWFWRQAKILFDFGASCRRAASRTPHDTSPQL